MENNAKLALIGQQLAIASAMRALIAMHPDQKAAYEALTREKEIGLSQLLNASDPEPVLEGYLSFWAGLLDEPPGIGPAPKY